MLQLSRIQMDILLIVAGVLLIVSPFNYRRTINQIATRRELRGDDGEAFRARRDCQIVCVNGRGHGF
jgi:hypothetical protein